MFSTDIKYLSFLINHNKNLLKNPVLEIFHDFINDLNKKNEQQLYQLREQSCEQLISTKTTNTIFQYLSTQER